MELMYPMVIVLSILATLAILFLFNNKKESYLKGGKIANTKYVKETKYYQNKLKMYKILLNAIKAIYALCIVVAAVLVSRPVTIITKEESKFNRDVILSIDVSSSQDAVNYEIVKQFRQMVPEVKGDRVGVVIFNTAPVVYCPLTTDYEYVDSCLEKIETALRETISSSQGGSLPSYDSRTIFYGGVIDNAEERGSSLIGDGLAGTIFSFPDVKTNHERTRIIVFATDNYLAGTETITLDEAAQLCKKYNINLYAYCPTQSMNPYVTKEYLAGYRDSVSKAGGKFYTGDLKQMTSQIVDEIKNTKKTELNTTKKTFINDHPETFVYLFTGLFVVLLIAEKRIKI